MKTHLVRIGNSRGIRIPKPLIEEARLSEEVDLCVRGGMIVIQPARVTRTGWARSARLLRERSEDVLLDPSLPTRFDEEEWEW